MSTAAQEGMRCVPVDPPAEAGDLSKTVAGRFQDAFGGTSSGKWNTGVLRCAQDDGLLNGIAVDLRFSFQMAFRCGR